MFGNASSHSKLSMLPKRIGRALLACALAVGLSPLAALAQAVPADAADTAVGALTETERAAIEQAQSDGTCTPGQALVVYHSSGAAKGATGALSAQSEADPLASAGFGASDTWDLSAADGVAESTGAASDGALSVQSEGTGSAIASGSDVRVALIERADMSVAELVSSLDSLDCVECAAPNYVYVIADSAAESALPVSTSSSASTSSASSSTMQTRETQTYTTQAITPQNTMTDDTYLDQQWALSGAGNKIAGSQAGIDYAAALAAEGSGTSDNIVAVLDSGVDYTNPDLAGVMWTNTEGLADGPTESHGYNGYSRTYDPMPGSASPSASHGTHVAGIIAAQSNNGQGVASVAGTGHTKIMGLRVTNDAAGPFTLSSLVANYDYMVKAKLAKVNIVAVNGSFGALSTSYDPVFDYLVNQAGKAGVLSCFASGNDGSLVTGAYQAVQLESPYAIIAGSSNADGSLSALTDYNPTAVDVTVPGTGILSTIPNSAFKYSFNSLLSKQAGKALTYYTDIASLQKNSSTGGETNFKAELVDWKNGTTLSNQSALVGLKTDGVAIDGEPALEITFDPTKLDSTYTSNTAAVSLTWDIPNPFKGKTITASDYSVNASLRTKDPTNPSQAFTEAKICLFGADGKNMVAPYNNGPANIIDANEYREQIEGGVLSSIDTTSDTLKAQLQILITNISKTDSLHTEASCAVSAYGIGRSSQTNDADATSLAYVPYGYSSGTSMAAPMLTGSIAELAALYHDKSALELRGIACGGTTLLASTSDQDKIASGGRFTFANALDDSKVNANTWSITTSGDQVTVHGYNLDDAKLYVDQSATAVTPAAQTGDSITFTASSSLLDGKTHRFDVVDGTTGRTYKAAYVTPDSSRDSLVRARDLPKDIPAGVLISSTDRLFCVDKQGSFLSSCSDPSDAACPWTALSAPGNPWTAEVGSTMNRSDIVFAYADGKLYAFATDDVPATGTEAERIAVYCNIYDIGTDSWSGYKTVDTFPSVNFAGVSAGSLNGSIWCYVNASPNATPGTLPVYAFFSCKSGSSDFTRTDMQVDIAAAWAPPSRLVTVGTNLYGLGLTVSTGSMPYGAAVVSYEPTANKLAIVGSIPSCSTSDLSWLLHSMFVKSEASVGNGIVLAGESLTGYGDLQLVGIDGSMAKLGSYGLSAADGLTVGSAAMYGGKLYLNCVDHATENANSTGLYALPDAAASKLASTDVTVSAAASPAAGGTASVSDWRGSASPSLSVREGDTATWTAEPAAGYHFAGWADASGSAVGAISDAN